jgi:predicted RNase H-like HicB family nuclease
MRINIDNILKKPYTKILIANEDQSYSAEILEFPGCYAQGETANEAIENLENSAKSWIEACLEMKQDIPEPFMNQGFGGKIALRLPRSLHRKATQLAQRDDVSLNQFLVSAISERIGSEDTYFYIRKQIDNIMEQNRVEYLHFTRIMLEIQKSVVSTKSYVNVNVFDQVSNQISATTSAG